MKGMEGIKSMKTWARYSDTYCRTFHSVLLKAWGRGFVCGIIEQSSTNKTIKNI